MAFVQKSVVLALSKWTPDVRRARIEITQTPRTTQGTAQEGEGGQSTTTAPGDATEPRTIPLLLLSLLLLSHFFPSYTRSSVLLLGSYYFLQQTHRIVIQEHSSPTTKVSFGIKINYYIYISSVLLVEYQTLI